MLLREERKQAINILVELDVTRCYDPSVLLKEVLADGHKGYNSYSDQELMRALSKIGKDHYRAQEFISNFLIDRIVLENQ